MRRSLAARKRLFRAALAVTGTTAEKWAASEGVTAPHVSQVLSGKQSARLNALIDAYVAKHMKGHKALVS
jgi:hypothetical protein